MAVVWVHRVLGVLWVLWYSVDVLHGVRMLGPVELLHVFFEAQSY